MIKTPEPLTNFCIVCNEVARRADLSARAKGIYYYLATLPANWQLTQQECQQHFTEGKDAFASAFSELVNSGYIIKSEFKNEKGQFSGYSYLVRWSVVDCGKPVPEKPISEKPISENPQLLNTKIINTKESKYKIDESILTKPTKKREIFKKPSLEQVADYFIEKQSTGFEAEKFFDYYESKGWVVGKSDMKSWQAACRNWIRNTQATGQEQKEKTNFEALTESEIISIIAKKSPKCHTGYCLEHLRIRNLYPCKSKTEFYYNMLKASEREDCRK